MIHDSVTGKLLRTRPPPLTGVEVDRLCGQPPSGPVPRPQSDLQDPGSGMHGAPMVLGCVAPDEHDRDCSNIAAATVGVCPGRLSSAPRGPANTKDPPSGRRAAEEARFRPNN